MDEELKATNPDEVAWLTFWRALSFSEKTKVVARLRGGPGMIMLTPEQAELIWTALRHSKPAAYPEARVRQVEALHIIGTELRRALGEFDDPPPG